MKTGPGLRITVRLTPKAGRDAIDGVVEERDGKLCLKARVRALPEDGKANAALEKLLAKALGVPRTHATVTAGTRSRVKSVRIAGDPGALAARLSEILTKTRGG